MSTSDDCRPAAAHSSVTLWVFSGLPATGKTALARRLAAHLAAAYFRLDTVEHALHELCGMQVQGEGYRLTQRLAAENLALGTSVVVDCCNPWTLTRDEWNAVGEAAGARCLNIEVVCSDRAEHRRRAESRESDLPGFILPSWAEIERRDYQAWEGERVVVETAGRSVEECLAGLLEIVGAACRLAVRG